MAAERVATSPLTVAGVSLSVLAVAAGFLSPAFGVVCASAAFVLSGLGLLIHRHTDAPRTAAVLGVLVSTTALVIVLGLALTTTSVHG